MAHSQGSYARVVKASSGQTPFLGTTEAPQVASTGTTNRRDKHTVIFCLLGIAELVLAVLMIVLAITTLYMTVGLRAGYGYPYDNVYITYPAQGLWGGVLVAITGILGVRTKKNPSVCMYNANMVMSIVTASLLPAVVILSGIASASGFAVSFHILITTFSFAAMVICIVHSAYCCAGVCCRSKQQYQAVMLYVPQRNQQVVRLANGQCAVPIGNTVMPQQYGYVMAESAQTPTAVYFQPPHTGMFAQNTVLSPQITAVQPAALNSPSIQDNSYANGVTANPPGYTTLPKN